MKKITNNSGIAFVGMLLFLVVLGVMSAVFVAQTVNELRVARSERENTAAFFAAQAGSQAALQQLDVLINTYLRNTIAAATPSGVINYATGRVAAGDGVGWLVYSVRDNNVPVLSQNGEQAEYAQSGSLTTGSYDYMIVMTEKTDPVTAGTDAWDFPFNFKITATGSSASASGDIVISGDFTVRVQRDNFAKFALFTNNQTTQAGTNVWFTDKTNFFGPVHTNDRFNFALNPSGTFTEETSQTQQTARFYNGGSPVLIDDDNNGALDAPVFQDTFTRGASAITFSASAQQTSMIDQATGGQSITTNGIHVPASGGALTGGIYVRGDGSVQLGTDASNNAIYTIAQGATTKRITVNKSAQQTTVEDLSAGSSQTYTGLPDGIDDAGTLIYVEGNVTALNGSVQSETEVTVASNNNITINDHIRYENYTPASGTPGTPGYVPPSATGTDNLLGIVSWNGNVDISTAAPDDIDIHGSVMAENGVFQVVNYNDAGVGPRGAATLLGGMISNNYGAFGLFNGSTGQQTSGYGRNFVYDSRMLQGKAPPYFPTLSTFVAFTNDITDKLVWQEGL